MSQSARKRAARATADSVCLLDTADAHGIDAYMPAWHAERARAGTKYRIGERLRSCPGCCACKSKPATKRALKRAGHPVCASLLKHGQAWICGKLIITIATNSINQIHTGRNHCDGSGILSAKRSK
jgi:hypothetical protein